MYTPRTLGPLAALRREDRRCVECGFVLEMWPHDGDVHFNCMTSETCRADCSLHPRRIVPAYDPREAARVTLDRKEPNMKTVVEIETIKHLRRLIVAWSGSADPVKRACADELHAVVAQDISKIESIAYTIAVPRLQSYVEEVLDDSSFCDDEAQPPSELMGDDAEASLDSEAL